MFRPCGQDSRDFTLYEQHGGSAYLICSSEGNKTLHVAPLNDDYEGVLGGFVRVFSEQERESPCVLSACGQLYLLTSGCTGWRANPALFGTAPHYVLLDHWDPDDLGASGYSILPVTFLPIKHDPIEIAWSDFGPDLSIDGH